MISLASFLQLNNLTVKTPLKIDLLNKFSSSDLIYHQAFSFLAAFSSSNSSKTNQLAAIIFEIAGNNEFVCLRCHGKWSCLDFPVFLALKNPLIRDHESFFWILGVLK